MARKVLIANETTRAAVLAVVMLAVLAASLGVAAMVSTPDSQVAGSWSSLSMEGLQLSVPAAWTVKEPAPPVPGLDAQTLLVDATRTQRRLLVGMVRGEGEGRRVLQEARQVLVDAEALAALRGTQVVQELSQGPLRAWTWRAMDAALGVPRLHKIAVLTRDGGAWWVLYLVALVEDGAVPLAQMQEDEHLFRVILQRASAP